MPIKKSTFENKWYYRVGKVLVLAAPLIAAIVAIWTGAIDVSGIKDHYSEIGANAFFESNKLLIAYIVGGIAGYYIAVSVIWKVFLYIAFGGMVDDTKKKPAVIKSAKAFSPGVPPNNADLIAYFKETTQKRGEAWLWIILIILFIWIAIYSSGSPSPSPTPKKQTCIPTGCGNLWRSSCTNKCYSTQSDCRATGAACNGNVTCRQCP